ncbi:triose-phosphate isomerase [Candidatus Micrarchaeota archaeon]|nr:triose-phosphate isomerase [Candidatus Micrarchaeota archaeon]
MIVLNLKTYPETIGKSLLFADIASEVVEETGVRIIVCPPSPFLKEAAERFSDIFAQHVDPYPPGAHTGSLPAELLKTIAVKGSLVNHSEKRIGTDNVKKAIGLLHSSALESIACAETPEEAVEIAHLSPLYVAIEPPELIGSGKSVSKTKPEIITATVSKIKDSSNKTGVLCGAGVSTKEDVKKALELGTDGVLLASAFVKAGDPKAFLRELASVF